MKKYLYLMRHGQAEVGSAKLDFERKLTPVGRTQVRRQAERFEQLDGIRPDCVLCSTAKRTVQTAENLNALFRGIPVFYRETLYLAPTYRLMDLIHETDDLFSRILIIGHNPGLEQFIGLLDEQSPPLPMKPADCVAVGLNIGTWAEVKAGVGKIEKIFPSGV